MTTTIMLATLNAQLWVQTKICPMLAHVKCLFSNTNKSFVLKKLSSLAAMEPLNATNHEKNTDPAKDHRLPNSADLDSNLRLRRVSQGSETSYGTSLIDPLVVSFEEESVPDLTNKLTHDALLILFSWLSVDDILTVMRVCHSWRVAAQGEYLWRNCEFEVRYGAQYKRKIRLMPHIGNIKGWDSLTFLPVILENVNKLKRLNVGFNPPIGALEVEQVIEKYPQLEFIKLCACASDITKSLEILKTSSHLKQVKFYSECIEEEYRECASDFMNIFTDCNNFSALTAINLPNEYHFEDAMKYGYFRDTLCNIIKNRSQQLSLLKLKYDINSQRILDAISQCFKLQTLHLCINFDNANVNIERMTQLRSLYLEAVTEDLNLFTNLHDSLYKGSWSHLTKVEIVNISVNASLLKAIIDNAKSLKSLTYKNKYYTVYGRSNTSDDQLEKLNTLLRLEKLKLKGIKNITETDICHIANCHSLKEIELASAHDLDISLNSNCFKDMLLKLNNLHSLIIRDRHTLGGKGLVKLYLKGRKHIEEHIASILVA